MLRRRLSRIAIAASTLVAAGCSLITSFDEYTSGVTLDASDDGTRPPVDASTEDVAKSEPDADADAYVPPLDCADATFCDDFERPDVLGDWEKSSTTDASAFAIDPARANSGYSSLQVILGSEQRAYAYLTKAFSAASAVRTRMFLYLPSDLSRDRDVLQIQFGYPSRLAFVSIVISVGQLVVGEAEILSDASVLQNVAATTGIARGKWVPIDVEIENAASPPTITVTVDGRPILTRTPLARTFGKGAFAVFLGTTYSNGGASADYGIDDFRMDAVP